MGAFNTVQTRVLCPTCKAPLSVCVQFKYGDTWQNEYSEGDQLRWGGNDIGTPGKRLVVVDGVAEDVCPKCGYDEERGFYVFIEHDRISRVAPATGEYNFPAVAETYIVLEE